MKIVISSGHGKYIRGASGFIDEVDEARRVVNRVADFLDEADVEVTVFHDDESTTQDENLEAIVDFHNSQERDLDVSVHFNAYNTTHSPMGTECWYYSQGDLASSVASEIAIASGLIDRGKKQSSSLYFLNNTNEPAILIEVCFVDSSVDVELYGKHFDHICRAIAETVSGERISDTPPDRPERPPPVWEDRPEDVPIEDRPTLRRGDEGPHVLDMQRMIPRFSGEFDGDFGPTTEENVVRYQRTRNLTADGICGPITWEALYDHKLPVPPPPPPPGALSPEQQIMIMRIADDSTIADYNWDDRGIAPTGWTQGMALAFGQSYKKLKVGHAGVVRMSQPRKDSEYDALNLYREDFTELGMSNEAPGIDTLRHLYALMLGHGMRESSGQHCCGRDQSADNVSSDTCEAGAFQTSYNAHSASSPEFDNLMDEYLRGLSPGYLEAFSEGVSCSASDWENYGSGRGEQFQNLCKNAPAFSAESCGLTLRNLCNHYGPIIRHETELRREANQMFQTVQDYIDETEPIG
jgi:peptidoglycan hydrolase-like protein with peptidoglycan-binding domain